MSKKPIILKIVCFIYGILDLMDLWTFRFWNVWNISFVYCHIKHYEKGEISFLDSKPLGDCRVEGAI